MGLGDEAGLCFGAEGKKESLAMSCGFACELCGKCNGEKKRRAGAGSGLVTPPRGLCSECGMLNKPSAKECASCGAVLTVPKRKVYVPGLDDSDNA